MTKPLVLLDVDGILADFVGASLHEIDRRLGVLYRAEQVTAWDFTSLPGWDLVKDRYWNEIAKGIGFCHHIPVYEGAVEGVARLRTVADVAFVTSPMYGSPTWAYERDTWLERHFGAHHHDVLHVRRKELVRGDVLVEDSPKNLAAWERAWAKLGILWRRPYNVGAPHQTVERWDELVEHVERHAASKAFSG